MAALGKGEGPLGVLLCHLRVTAPKMLFSSLEARDLFDLPIF